MNTEGLTRFDAKQIARQEGMVQRIKELASEGSVFILKGPLILEGAEAFEIELSDEARKKLPSFELGVPSLGYGKTNRNLLENSIKAVISHVERLSEKL